MYVAYSKFIFSTHQQENNINMVIEGTGHENFKWMNLSQDRCGAFVDTAMELEVS
jgi:hypothetical protein